MAAGSLGTTLIHSGIGAIILYPCALMLYIPMGMLELFVPGPPRMGLLFVVIVMIAVGSFGGWLVATRTPWNPVMPWLLPFILGWREFAAASGVPVAERWDDLFCISGGAAECLGMLFFTLPFMVEVAFSLTLWSVRKTQRPVNP
jgi:hypothetical protein